MSEETNSTPTPAPSAETTAEQSVDHFRDALSRAKKISSDAGSIEKTSVAEAIEYDRYQRAREAQRRNVSPFASMGYARIEPGGPF